MSNNVEDKADNTEDKSKDGQKDKKFKPPKKISARYLHNSGLAYLQRFPASSYHFRSVMMRKIDKSCRHHKEQDREKCSALLDELIEKFKDLRLLDDESYLKGMVTSLRRRGLSAMQIQVKLSQKGFTRDDIQNVINNHDKEEYFTDSPGDHYAALVFARKKKLGPFDLEKKRSPDKSLATMARAGYSYDIAKRTLEKNIEEAEETLRSIL